MPSSSTPKDTLLGMSLPSGWKLIEQMKPGKDATGGNFGTGYKATRGNDVAFVKAIDFVEALSSSDVFARLQQLLDEATFEKDVLEFCTANRMHRVIKFLGYEEIHVGDRANPLNRVYCLIMELGQDDLRRTFNRDGIKNCTWNLSVAEDIALALAQLHGRGIAHQDVKPSNVISVAGIDDNGKVKLSDMGRVVRRDLGGPFNGHSWPGDLAYRPPERWYGYTPNDWNDAREAADVYMLGSLMVFLFCGTSLQSLVMQKLPDQFKPTNWRGGFDDNLLAVLDDVHMRILHEQFRNALPETLAESVVQIVISLTRPDPKLRGHIRARQEIGRPVGIQRLQQMIASVAARSRVLDRVALNA